MLSEHILAQILSYLPLCEILRSVLFLNRTFNRVCIEYFPLLVKDPSETFSKQLAHFHQTLCDIDQSKNILLELKECFEISGCNIVNIQAMKVKEEPKTYSFVLTCIGDESIALNNEKLPVKTFWPEIYTEEEQQLVKVLEMIFKNRLTLAREAAVFLLHLLDDVFKRVIEDFLSHNETTVITLELIENSLSRVFTPQLNHYANIQYQRALRNYRRNPGEPCEGEPPIFSTEFVQKKIIKDFHNLTIADPEVLVILATAMEYVSAEVLEISGNASMTYESNEIRIIHIKTAVSYDVDLHIVLEYDLDEEKFDLIRRQFKEVIIHSVRKLLNKQCEIELEPFQLQMISFDPVFKEKYYHELRSRPFIEGVSVVNNMVSETLVTSLRKGIEGHIRLKNNRSDSQPTNKPKIVDHICSRGYAFTPNISRFTPSADLSDLYSCVPLHIQNYFQAYRRIATYIDNKNGFWKFRGEIMCLPLKGNEDFYENLETLFALAIPSIELCLGYEIAMRAETFVRQIESYPLKGKSLQVICKIVDYELLPGEETNRTEYFVDDKDGRLAECIVVHVEFTLDNDDDLVGGDLLFERRFLPETEECLFHEQSNIFSFKNAIKLKRRIPLGRVQRKTGQLVVYPKTHIQTIEPMKNEGTSIKKRRVIGFSVVDPEFRILSTQEVSSSMQVERISDELARTMREGIMPLLPL